MREFIYSLLTEGRPIIGIVCSLLYLLIPAIVIFATAILLQKFVDKIKYKFFE